VDGLLTGKRYLIHDRDPLFTEEFLSTLKVVGVESVKLPPRRAIRAQYQAILLGATDPIRRDLIANGGSKLRGPLS
jgi:hypothetical protein